MSTPNLATMSNYNLAMLAEMLTDARDTAHRAADEADQCLKDLRQDRTTADRRPDSVFAEISRDNAAATAREVALAEWAANALALSALYLSTNGDYGQPYQDQPSPYRRRATERPESADSREGVTS